MLTKIDLVKQREDDKKKPKVPLTDEDIALNKEQAETGKTIEAVMERERMLRRNKEQFNNDDSFFLYRLPLSEKQREIVYNNLMDEPK